MLRKWVRFDEYLIYTSWLFSEVLTLLWQVLRGGCKVEEFFGIVSLMNFQNGRIHTFFFFSSVLLKTFSKTVPLVIQGFWASWWYIWCCLRRGFGEQCMQCQKIIRFSAGFDSKFSKWSRCIKIVCWIVNFGFVWPRFLHNVRFFKEGFSPLYLLLFLFNNVSNCL